MEIYCCECKKKIIAVQKTGKDKYPHRKDLYGLQFWECPNCFNFVGCHKNSKTNQPLGNIAGKKLKQARMYIHKILDPLWKNRQYKRRELYNILSKKLNWKYHTSRIKTIEEARIIYKYIQEIKRTGGKNVRQ